MIVDIHNHPFFGSKELAEGLLPLMEGFIATVCKRAGRPMDENTVMDKLMEKIPDPDGEKLIKNMDESGIDFSVMLMIDFLDIPAEVNQEINKTAGRVAQKYPERLMALAGVDPRRENAPDLLKQCFEEYGCRGLKYHPDLGYDPSSPESYKLYEIIIENKGILLSHTGPLGVGMRSRMAEASLLADVVTDFPEMPIIAAHMGFINWKPWASLAAYNPNFYGDTAMWDETALGNYPLFCKELRNLIDFAGIEKIMFGTDDPYPAIIRPTSEYIQMIRDLPKNAPEGIEFKQEEVDAILGGNAAKLLSL